MSFFQAVTGAVVRSATPSIITDNLSLHLNANNPASYPGSGTAWDDISVNENSVTLTNGPTYSTDDGGYIQFDGVNDYGDEASTTGTPFAFGTGAFTVEQWVNVTTDTKASVFFDARRRSSFYSNNQNYSDYYLHTNGKYNVYINNATVLTSNGTLSINQWYHIVVSRVNSTSNQTRLYINNVLDKTVTISNSMTDYGNFYVGRSIDGNYASAKIAQVRVYKGKALTASEVTNNWNATRALYGL